MIGLRTGIKPSAGVVYGLALAFIFGIALFLRTYFSYHDVFTGDWVRFQSEDAYYHMRLIENLSHHFPHRIYFDPFTFYPHGQTVYFAPFFDLFIGFFIWVIGLGSPSTHVIETVGAYFPAVLGALVTFPVYFIGKELFNRKAGLIAAALVVILPGQFLSRSLLGSTDHHVAETLFSTLIMLFLILAVKRAKEKELSFSSLRKRDWRSLRKPLIYSLLAGIALGCYLLSWVGAGLVLLIIFVFFFIQYIIDHVRGRSTDYLCIVGVPAIFIALLMIAPFKGVLAEGNLYVASLLLGILAFLALSGLSVMMNKRSIGRFYYPLALVVLGLIGVLVFYFVDRPLLKSLLDVFGVFSPRGSVLTIQEVRPLSLNMAWEEFTTGFYLALISLVLIVYLVIKEQAAYKTLFLIWSMIMLVATLGQNRFAYYFAVNVALLTAYLSWQAVNWGSSFIKVFGKVKGGEDDTSERRRKERGKAKLSKKAKRKKAKEQRRDSGTLVPRGAVIRYGYSVIAILIVFFLAFYPNIGRAIDVAGRPPRPNNAWHDALIWMRDKTPDPFQNPDFYYGLYERPSGKEGYKYPTSAYGVMSWWDYGHYITYIAHRIPNSNPHQAGATAAALFFTAQDESSANGTLDKLGSKYIIIDYPMAMHKQVESQGGRIFGTFYAMIEWAGGNEKDFFEMYYQKTQAGGIEPIMLYYPEYYQSMCTRLYIFGGEAAIPQNSTLVVSYVEKTAENGVRYKEISYFSQFATYDEAKSYLDSQTGSNYRIVGNDPFASPVPLEELNNYKLIYESPYISDPAQGTSTSWVKIFEYSL
jgi:dolichyl-diphosphooligosaccharide--protein glycosyltransferase